ncbi:hypothetical protein C8F01DRAFT_1370886 [Mycena amicta]|nr:hypothetical protein C8F01DRAFT_1370886 [Mycena amicta]
MAEYRAVDGLPLTYIVNKDMYDQSVNVLRTEFIVTCAATLCYVIYLCYAALSIWILAQQESHAGNRLSKRFFTVTTCILFAFGTTQLVLRFVEFGVTLRLSSDEVLGSSQEKQDLALYQRSGRLQLIVFVLNNALADAILIFRCFKIWNTARYVIMLPISFAAVTAITGMISAQILNQPWPVTSTQVIWSVIPFLFGAFTNLLLVLLTAGRIWWIWRKSSHVSMATGIRRRYSLAVIVILESGLLYILVTGSVAVMVLAANGRNVGYGYQVSYYVILVLAQHFINIIPSLPIVHIQGRQSLQEAVRFHQSITAHEKLEARSRERDTRSLG